MTRILVATDLSERSRQAVRRAVDLAAEAGADLTILHVVDETLPPDLSRQVQVGAETILKEQAASDASGRPVAVEVSVTVGDAIEKIDACVASCGADLLIVGMHRRRTFLDQVRETTMEHLIRSSRIPVLLVAGQAGRPYENVLTGVALSRSCASVLHKLSLVAPKASVTLFHAHEVSFGTEAGNDYKTWTAMFPLPENLPEPILIEASAEDALHQIMREGRYDLLAIGGHTRSNAGRYLLGRFTSGLIRNPPCDLLVAK